jgi:hypothetical protein
MHLIVRINETEDGATPAVIAAAERYKGRTANAAMAASVAVRIQEHLRLKNFEPNKMNAPKTNFYSQARDATFFEADAAGAAVYIAKDGIRQRYYGGTIRPVNRRALTIPVDRQSYGREASEFGDELRFVAVRSVLRPNVVGLLVLGKESDAPVMYVLMKEVEQQPDPSVLPYYDVLQAAAIEGLAELPL